VGLDIVDHRDAVHWFASVAGAACPIDNDQSLFPLRDSRAKRTRERASAKIACRVET